MYRPALRATAAATGPFARNVARSQIGKRFASTASKSSGSWRGAAVRWGLAGGLVYYYNTSSIFAEEPQYALHTPPETPHESETYSTVESVAEQRRAQARAQLQSSSLQTDSPTVAVVPDGEPTAPGDPSALEEEASQQGAFNEETGEINWDCPCLGGMAYGPCGEQFRAAFSCFVFSKEDPKGVDCIEHFKTMQNCFREHPEIYGSEIDEDEEVRPLEGEEGQSAPSPARPQVASDGAPASQKAGVLHSDTKAGADAGGVPKVWHDEGEKSTTQ